jgi:DegV family protein with EDD domain
LSERKVAIITDASSDLPPELVEKHKITILPILINFESKTYKVEGIEKGITWDEYYSLVDKEIPTTAIPGPGVFLKAFEEVLTVADTVIGLFISEKLSGTFRTAQSVVKQHLADKDVSVYDTQVTCSSLGLIALEAARLASAGKSKEEVAKKVEEWLPELNLRGIMNTLDNLERAGRISKAKKFMANILKFKPVCGYVDGEVHIYGQLRADDKLIIQQMKRLGVEALRNMHPDNKTVFINHTRWPEAAEEIAKHMEKHNPENKEIIIQETGPLTSFFTGRKLLTVDYIGKFDPDWLLKTK